MKMNPGLFVTGTDTGVGKTLVTGGLAACLAARGISIGVMKPVETGCSSRKGERVPRDGSFLRHMAGVPESLSQIVPYRLTAPLAPQVAAQREAVRIRLSHIRNVYNRLSARYALTLVEGAGGLFVPITARSCMLHLIQRLEIPVLLVARAGLGTLNHTLLTLDCLERNQIPVVGIVLNDPDNTKGLAVRTNPAVLRQWSKPPLLGSIPHIKDVHLAKPWKKKIAETLEAHAQVERLLRRTGGFVGSSELSCFTGR